MSFQSINKGSMLSDGYIIGNWRKEPITQKQKEYIEEMQKVSHFPLPQFDGKTKGEACDYIEKYREFAYMNLWAIEHEYE